MKCNETPGTSTSSALNPILSFCFLFLIDTHSPKIQTAAQIRILWFKHKKKTSVLVAPCQHLGTDQGRGGRKCNWTTDTLCSTPTKRRHHIDIWLLGYNERPIQHHNNINSRTITPQSTTNDPNEEEEEEEKGGPDPRIDRKGETRLCVCVCSWS